MPAGAGGLLKARGGGVGRLLEGGQSGATSSSRRGKVRLLSSWYGIDSAWRGRRGCELEGQRVGEEAREAVAGTGRGGGGRQCPRVSTCLLLRCLSGPSDTTGV